MYEIRGLLSKHLVENFSNLGEKGFQVINDAIKDPDQVKANIENDIENLKKYCPEVDLSLLQQYGAGQWESMWNCRAQTIHVWSSLFNTNNLVSSWDGLSVLNTHQQLQTLTSLNEFSEPDWLHRDQRLSNRNLADTIQGFLSLSDNEEETYSTIFYVPKHTSAQEMIDTFHDKFYNRYSKYGRKVCNSYTDDDYYVFSEIELQWLREHCDLVKPVLKKGDLLLWCSPMPHAAACSKNCTINTPGRFGTYISMFPKDMISNEHLKERKKLSKHFLTSSHNVLYPRLFPFLTYNTPEKIKLPIYSQELNKIRDSLIF